MTNSLVISAGCHAGYNLLDADGVPGVTLGLDWPEEMARQRATFIGGTGYQYADTDFLAYSAKLYALLATQLRSGTGAVAIGPALVNAKQDYLAGVSSLTGIDQKALIESTLYGLPMTGARPARPVARPARHRARHHPDAGGDWHAGRCARSEDCCVRCDAAPHYATTEAGARHRRQSDRCVLPLAHGLRWRAVRPWPAGIAEADRRRDQLDG